MDSWDIRSLELEPHHPQVLRSDNETRVIALNLPGGEELQDHQVHERAYLVVVDGDRPERRRAGRRPRLSGAFRAQRAA
jgi:hypothetical protein